MHLRNLFAGITLATLPLLAFANNLNIAERLTVKAIKSDPWFYENDLIRASNEADAKAELEWDSPKVNIGINNLPVGSWDFNQEPMTQFNIGVIQTLPRGDSIALSSNARLLQNAVLKHEKYQRVLQTLLTYQMKLNELAALRMQLKINDRQQTLIGELEEVTQSAYRDLSSSTSQSNFAALNLALVELKDQALDLSNQIEIISLQITQPLVSIDTAFYNEQLLSNSISWNSDLHLISANDVDISKMNQRSIRQPNSVYQRVQLHPLVLKVDAMKSVAQTNVELSKQNHTPAFSLSAKYGKRQDDNFGRSRDDFFSIGLIVDIPLFNQASIEQKIKAKRFQANAKETQRRIVIKELGDQLRYVEQRIIENTRRLNYLRQSSLSAAITYEESLIRDYANQNSTINLVFEAINKRLDIESREINLRLKMSNQSAQRAYLLSDNKKAIQLLTLTGASDD